MPKRSGRWTLETMQHPCRCGALAQHRVNARSRERLMFAHPTPTGETCPFWVAQENAERTRRICEQAGVPYP